MLWYLWNDSILYKGNINQHSKWMPIIMVTVYGYYFIFDASTTMWVFLLQLVLMKLYIKKT